MYRLMLDTNILLDLVSADRPAHQEAVALFISAVSRSACRLHALASSLKDVYFIYERHYGSETDARQKVALLCELLELVDCTSETVQRALASDEPDLEDGMVRVAAEQIAANAIVTRDKPGFANSTVAKVGYGEAIAAVQKLNTD